MPASKMDVKLVTVTPALAHEWLGYNTHNRKMRLRTVAAYAADMAGGNWQWNGETVKFSVDGTLLDGQHRLAGIVEAGVEVPLLVVRGLPNETQDTVDGGVKRKFADVLHLRGERYPNTLAAVARRVTIWEAGGRRTGGNYAPTNAQMFQTLEKYPGLRETARLAEQVGRGCALPASILGLGWWLFSQLSTEDAAFFFARLGDGQSLIKGDPIYELRKAAEASKTVRGERSETYLTAILIKAWNAYRSGEDVGVLRFRPGGAHPEKFPKPE